MVAVLPDSSPDLWRLCHNLGRASGRAPARPPHLVAVQEMVYQFYDNTNKLLDSSDSTLTASPPPLEVWGRRVYGRGAISPTVPGRGSSCAGSVWYNP